MKWLREAMRSVRIDKSDVPSDKDDELPKAVRGGSSYYGRRRSFVTLLLTSPFSRVPSDTGLVGPFLFGMGAAAVARVASVGLCLAFPVSLIAPVALGRDTIRLNLHYICHQARNRTYLAPVFRERTEQLLLLLAAAVEGMPRSAWSLVSQ